MFEHLADAKFFKIFPGHTTMLLVKTGWHLTWEGSLLS
jgi:hypothetical protein